MEIVSTKPKEGQFQIRSRRWKQRYRRNLGGCVPFRARSQSGVDSARRSSERLVRHELASPRFVDSTYCTDEQNKRHIGIYGRNCPPVIVGWHAWWWAYAVSVDVTPISFISFQLLHFYSRIRSISFLNCLQSAYFWKAFRHYHQICLRHTYGRMQNS